MIPHRRIASATTLMALLTVSCGPNTTTVTSQNCQPAFSRYDDVWGKRTLGYDRDDDGIIDEAIQAAIGPDDDLTAQRLSTLPLGMWTHYAKSAANGTTLCWTTGRTKDMKPDDEARFAQMWRLQTEY